MTAALPALTAAWRLRSHLCESTLLPPASWTRLSLRNCSAISSRSVVTSSRHASIGRVVGPADVAALAVHIMTDAALTGATYDIDGGQQFVAA